MNDYDLADRSLDGSAGRATISPVQSIISVRLIDQAKITLNMRGNADRRYAQIHQQIDDSVRINLLNFADVDQVSIGI
jgi:hypothetical protein